MTMSSKTRDRLEPFRRVAHLVPGGMALGRWINRQFDPQLRSIAAAQRDHGEALFQPFPTTGEDRYPELFDALADRLAGVAQPRILSFGCASGAEVRALRRRFPQARIVGIDANALAIAQARKADRNPLSEYRLASTVPSGECYDAILALAVFRHGNLEETRPESCARILPFARVEQGLAMLDTCLVSGGYLAIWNAHYRFCDTLLSIRYEVDPFRLSELPQLLLYGPDDRQIDGETYAEVLFRKH